MLKDSRMAKEKRDALVGSLVPAAIKEELLAIAERDDRSLSFVAGSLLERGLLLYRKDKILRAKDSDRKLGVIGAKTEDPPQRKRKP